MEGVRVSDRDRVRWIELHRPESRNGLTNQVNEAIIAALEEVGADPEIRAVVFTGGGGHFCSGLDLRSAAEVFAAPQPGWNALETHFHGLIRAVRALAVPSIAAVDGYAVGFGLDLALAFDIRLASDRARFGEIFVRRGLMPDGGSTFHLPRLVGVGRALELMFTGDVIDAAEALRIGLVNQVHEAGALEPAAAAFAGRLAAGPPMALARIKRAVYASLDGDLDAALEREASGQKELLASADVREGVAAFLTKRPPAFKGK